VVPLLNKKIKYNEKLKNVLNHPNWKMGKKITIDSSNLANKILELFEAKILFNIPGKKLEILIEATSSTHAIIKLDNDLYFPIMHKPRMEIPISNSLKIYSKKKLNFET
jgi:1-deoxy-D-xylulose-5-phosphate reductoisomerase